MERYIAVDSGKSSTKVATYDVQKNKVEKFKFLTKIGEGNFDDDAIENCTYIMGYEGCNYKVGYGAKTEAEMETSKQTIVHKISTLLAIAMKCSDEEVDEVHAAIGIPVKDYENVEKRNAYRNFILPDGELSVTLKLSSDAAPVTRKFKIVSKHVYPETKGALFIEDEIDLGVVAVIDIGHLNVNQTVYQNLDIDHAYSLTDVLGGNNLVTGLSQELSSAFSLCDEKTIARVLTKPYNERYLKPNKPNPDVEKRSKDMIDKYMIAHVKEIKKKCDSKRWPIDYMTLIFIGGTSTLLKKEIREVFGDNVIIPKEPEYANVLGFLRIMCAKLLDKQIPLYEKDKEKVPEK